MVRPNGSKNFKGKLKTPMQMLEDKEISQADIVYREQTMPNGTTIQVAVLKSSVIGKNRRDITSVKSGGAETFFVGRDKDQRVEYFPKTKELSFSDVRGETTKAFPVTEKQLRDIKTNKKLPVEVFNEYQLETLKLRINQDRNWLSRKPAFVPKTRFEDEMIALNRIARSKGDTVVFEQGRSTYKYKVTKVTSAKINVQDVKTGKKSAFPTSYVADGLIRKMGGDMSQEGTNYFSFINS